MTHRIKVVLAEDGDVLRRSLADSLREQPDIQVLDEAADGEELVALCRETPPDVAVVDIRMPGMSGLECQNELIARHADLPVVFLSAHADISMAVNAVQKGASGFLVKPPRPDELTEQIQKAVALHEKRLKMRRELAQIEQQLAGLTPAEYDTALLIAKGLSNADIAEVLKLTEGTVRRRRMDIGNKLDARNAVEVGELFRWMDTLKEALP